MGSSDTNAELLGVACELARLGADTARALLGNVAVERKDDDTPVTEADHRAQSAMIDYLAAKFPSHSILVEERVDEPNRHAPIGQSDYCWVIDPIDGTRNFARGQSMFATSVGLLHCGVPAVAAILDASSGRLYSAMRGRAAFCDDQPIRMRNRPLTSDTVLFVSSFRARQQPPAVAGWMRRFLFRNLGSICIHSAWLAAGFADGAYAPECKLWDLAAGALLIAEAGGVLTDVTGRDLWPIDVATYRRDDIPILAGTPTMHAELIRTLEENGRE